MKYADLSRKGRSISNKAVAGIAGYQTAVKTAKVAGDMFCHVLSIDEDYTWALYEAAITAATDHQHPLPKLNSKVEARFKASTSFCSEEWTIIVIPGVCRLMQARKKDSDTIEFRTPLKRELVALREYLDIKVEEAEDMAPEVELKNYASHTEIYSWGKGEWDYRSNKRSRSFNSVLLPAELQAEIEHDLRQYTESRERLQRLEIPWRRGYLLSGPPGTGKTSLSLAIAASLNFSLASLSLTDIKSDGELRKAISTLRGRTVLVIEDIDAYAISHVRDHNTAKDGDLSLSGLLNSLDGFETPDGLVTIATTNHIEKLDPALVRSGRFDRNFTLDYIEATELERLFQWFYEEESPKAPEGVREAKLAPAEVTELFKQNLNDSKAGWNAVLKEIGAPVQEISPKNSQIPMAA